jgi:ppGpp synthetase/RelA/SpoT-type nucleotidyltranferase
MIAQRTMAQASKTQIEISGKTVEIQVRTRFQHIWAEISEKYADLYGSEIKYGGGAPNIRWILEICRMQSLDMKITKEMSCGWMNPVELEP